MAQLDRIDDALIAAIADPLPRPTTAIIISAPPAMGILTRIRQICETTSTSTVELRCALFHDGEARACDLQTMLDAATKGDGRRLVAVLDEAADPRAETLMRNIADQTPGTPPAIAVLNCLPGQEDQVRAMVERVGNDAHAEVDASRFLHLQIDMTEMAQLHADWARANGHEDHAAFIEARGDLAGTTMEAWMKLLEVEATPDYATHPSSIRDAFATGVVGAEAFAARRAWLDARKG